MMCKTVKPDKECLFAGGKDACNYPGGKCFPVVKECDNCRRIREFESGRYCTSYANPEKRWRLGMCPLNTNVVAQVKVVETTKKLNPIKAAKRAKKGK